MVLIFESEINKESVQNFCDAVVLAINNLQDDEILNIYLATEGGTHNSIYPIVDILLRYKDKINLYLDHVMYSAGFLILLYIRSIPIKLKPSFRNAMIHTMYFDVNTADTRKREDEKELKNRNNSIYEKLKIIGFTPIELKKFKNQQDVYISKERLLELFPNITEQIYEL